MAYKTFLGEHAIYSLFSKKKEEKTDLLPRDLKQGPLQSRLIVFKL